ncbi:MAG TPA: VWA domain-containing protein [Bryobacteraceae bacterium]|jgi:VWFA-related protein|nr:VWA domain-containing protein [Bryobacteraceae bacterium]
MKSPFLRAALGSFVLALLAAGQQKAPPQPPAPVPQDDTTHISVEVTRVSMAFSVTDRKGRFVTGLQKGDFEVLENGRPQTVAEFTAEPSMPLRVAVLIDTSNSIRERFKFEQEAASSFLDEILRTTQDKAMVVSFDTAVQTDCDLTSNTDKLGAAIHQLRPGGGTSFYDALKFASERLGEEQPSYQFRRIMVIVSDGEDNQSHFTRDQALEAAQLADTFIYAISTNNLSAGDTDGDKVLKYFTSQTGGKTYFPFKLEDLTSSFQTIAEEVRHQYNITYRPEPLENDGRFHKVEIRVHGHKELSVYARQGYYARKS